MLTVILIFLFLAAIAFVDHQLRKSSVAASAVKVIDGDTIEINGKRCRLAGIDAPEWKQPGGRAAQDHLRAFIRSAVHLKIYRTSKDAYKRPVILITTDEGVDINAEMVRGGHAVAYTRYTNRYTTLMREACAAKRGIWALEGFELPEAFRHR
jgi:endonuclease YncB( thermonuclease family)